MPNVPISGFTVPANTVGIGLTGYSLTGSSALSMIDLAGTWNTSGTPAALKLNVTDTASAAGSLLMDLQVGGGSRFSVSKLGGLTIQGNRVIDLNSGSLFFQNPGNGFSFALSGDSIGASFASITVNRFAIKLNSAIGFTASTDANSTASLDTILTRRGAANLRLGAADTGSNTATVTITIATPGVVTWTSHGLSTGTPVFFTTTGALPTGITASTTYYVIAVDANTFQIATTLANAYAGTAVNTSGSQSGTQTGNRNAITQRLSVQSVTGVTDRPGADLLLTGSQGTGTGAGGSIIFQVAPAGSSGSAQNALATALTIDSARFALFAGKAAFDGQTSTAYSVLGASVVGTTQLGVVTPGSSNHIYMTTSELAMKSTLLFGFTGGDAAGGIDVALRRDAANTLALRNGANAQTFRVYNTESSSLANFERLNIGWDASGPLLSVTAGGSGSAAKAIRLNSNNAIFNVGSSGGFFFGSGSGNWWNINNSGHLVCPTDNTYDIGASGATRPRDLFLGRNFVQGGAYHEMAEMTAPAAPAANGVRIYAVDNGSGKTQLMALFATGAAQQIAIEP